MWVNIALMTFAVASWVYPIYIWSKIFLRRKNRRYCAGIRDGNQMFVVRFDKASRQQAIAVIERWTQEAELSRESAEVLQEAISEAVRTK